MSIYFLSAVRLDKTGRVTEVLWYRPSSLPTEYHPSRADVIKVVDALQRGGDVYLIVEAEPGVHVIRSKFHTVVYAGGAEGIENDEVALKDLPTF